MHSLREDDHRRVAVETPIPPKRWVPVTLPRSNPPQKVTSGSSRGDLNPHSSCVPQPVELPQERTGPSQGAVPAISFGALMSITASEGEPDDLALLPPSGNVALLKSDPEMMAMLA